MQDSKETKIKHTKMGIINLCFGCTQVLLILLGVVFILTGDIRSGLFNIIVNSLFFPLNIFNLCNEYEIEGNGFIDRVKNLYIELIKDFTPRISRLKKKYNKYSTIIMNKLRD